MHSLLSIAGKTKRFCEASNLHHSLTARIHTKRPRNVQKDSPHSESTFVTGSHIFWSLALEGWATKGALTQHVAHLYLRQRALSLRSPSKSDRTRMLYPNRIVSTRNEKSGFLCCWLRCRASSGASNSSTPCCLIWILLHSPLTTNVYCEFRCYFNCEVWLTKWR